MYQTHSFVLQEGRAPVCLSDVMYESVSELQVARTNDITCIILGANVDRQFQIHIPRSLEIERLPRILCVQKRNRRSIWAKSSMLRIASTVTKTLFMSWVLSVMIGPAICSRVDQKGGVGCAV
jgi:hypothetical protein